MTPTLRRLGILLMMSIFRSKGLRNSRDDQAEGFHRPDHMGRIGRFHASWAIRWRKSAPSRAPIAAWPWGCTGSGDRSLVRARCCAPGTGRRRRRLGAAHTCGAVQVDVRQFAHQLMLKSSRSIRSVKSFRPQSPRCRPSFCRPALAGGFTDDAHGRMSPKMLARSRNAGGSAPRHR